jgi:hypothetical protein
LVELIFSSIQIPFLLTGLKFSRRNHFFGLRRVSNTIKYNFLSSLPATDEDNFSDDELQILQNLQLTAIRHLVRGTSSSSSLLFARQILLSIVLLYQQESFSYRYIDELVRALVSSIDQSQIITTPGHRQTVYNRPNYN